MRTDIRPGRNGKAIFLAAFAAVSGAVAIEARGATTINYVSGSYFQDFNNLISTTGTSMSFTGQGVVPLDVIHNGTPINGWQFSKFAGSSADPKFIVDDGAAASFGGIASGATYSLGAAGSNERSLGSLASGSLTPVFGGVFVNNSTSTYTAFTLSYTGEQWRDGNGGINTLNFGYGVGNTDVLNGTFTAATGLNFSSPVNGGGVGDVALDGNLPANQTAKSATINGISWGPGQTLVVRWTDTNDGGNDDELGIDDLTFSAGFAGKNLTWNPGSTTWNNSNINWLDGATPSNFSSNDTVNFTDVGVGVVNVDAGGVTPGDVNVSNTAGTYTFTGGAIGGSGKLTKTNGGSLTLQNANTFTGGVALNGGVTTISADSGLGASSGNVSMGGGTLMLAGNVDSTRNVSLTAGTIDTNGNSGTFANFTGSGNLTKRGAGTLTASGNYAVTGFTRVLGGTLKLAQTSGTGTLQASEDADFVGDLVIANAMRLNIQGGHISGGGNVLVQSTGATISNSGNGNTIVIDNNILLNSNNVAGPFVTTFGGTGGNDVTMNGVISGNSDLNLTSGAAGGGSGTIVFNNHNTYTGSTLINNGTSAAGAGVIKIGIDNALPTGTNVVVNTIGPVAFAGPGIMDLNGHTQTIASLVNGTGAGTSTFVIQNNAATPGTLVVSGSVTPSGSYSGRLADGTGPLQLVKSGSNTLSLSGSNTYTGGTTISGGTLSMTGTQAWSPVLNGPGTTDIQTGRAVFDYSGGGSDPAAQIQSLLTASFASNFATGQLHSSTATTSLGLGWRDVTANSQAVVAYTYYGDANLDLTVDTVDFNLLAANFSGGGKVWEQGDFNYDTNVDTVDFNLLAANFGKTAPGASAPAPGIGTLVPEPGSLAILGLAAGGLMARRRRR
jgi:autotransporter-associated beta strand protein